MKLETKDRAEKEVLQYCQRKGPKKRLDANFGPKKAQQSHSERLERMHASMVGEKRACSE